MNGCPRKARPVLFPRRFAAWALVGVLALAAGLAAAPEEPADVPEMSYAEKALRKAGVSSDGRGLVEFIRTHTFSEEKRNRLAKAVKQLGSESYPEREKASRDLVAVGRPALPYLRDAVNHPDLELARRARLCIDRIQRLPTPSLMTLAALGIKARRPAGAVPVLLDYLPDIEDEGLEETWLDVLRAVCWRDGRPDPALLSALTDRRPSLRAAAAHVVGRGPSAELRARVKPMLRDGDLRVRYEAAAALAGFGDRDAVRCLLALLTDAPLPLACRAEYLLFLVADGHGPDQTLERDEAASRRRCRDAWEAWWRRHGDKADLGRLLRDELPRGLTLVGEAGDEGGRVWQWGQAGQPCWEITGLEGPTDARMLPGDRVLVAEHHGNRVTERDLGGKVLWEHRTTVNPIACQRLPGGNTLVVTYYELYEVTPRQQKVFRLVNRRDFRDALRLPGGRLLYVTRDGVVIERDTELGSDVLTIRPEEHAEGARFRARVEPLVNGRYLLTLGGANRVVEIDRSNKIRWECTVTAPMSAARLRNGHTLVAAYQDRCVVEVDRAGQVVKKIPLRGRPFVVRRY